MLRYIKSNCKAVNRVDFVWVDFNQLNLELIKGFSKKIEHLKMVHCEFDGDIWRSFIESCVNLKRKTFWGNVPSTWPVRTYDIYPTVQHLELYETDTLDIS